MEKRDEYKLKLIAFNNTPKYVAECDYLIESMGNIAGKKILDYGCGTGELVRKINGIIGTGCFGYDVRNFRTVDDPAIFRESYFFKFHVVYFMHSIAHIPDLPEKLHVLKTLLHPDAKIYVITPNKLWINQIKWPDYIPDSTVIDHFTPITLAHVFIESGFKINLNTQFGEQIGDEHERLFLECQFNG
jgi:2-polyprenyl-3-methyl-5-hydroxy-6-metoxy-1,4-benzoquinol methylase